MTALSEEQKSVLKTAFEDIDINKTGQISKSEIRSALQLTGQSPTSEEMTSLMETREKDQMTLEEFYDFIEQNVSIKTHTQIVKELADAFEKFKDSADLYISKEEFRKVMTKLGDEPLSENDADKLIESLNDIENDGRYHTEEIAKLFMR